MAELQRWFIITLLAWIGSFLVDPWRDRLAAAILAMIALLAWTLGALSAYHWIRDERRRS